MDCQIFNAPESCGTVHHWQTKPIMSARTEDWLPRHRLNVDDYYRMAAAGVLARDARVELIEGEIIDMAPIGSRHSGTVSLLARRLAAAIGESAIVATQSPLRLSQLSESQPDLLLLKPRADFYRQSHPEPADVLLLIEVCESSLRYDQQVKLPLYARHGVAEV
jgi:Uma2 family endonuclease